MGCNCKGTVVSQPKCDNDNCLIITSIRFGCDSSLKPCGDTLEIDLKEYNDVTASPCDVVYSIVSYDETLFTVTTTTDGVVTVISKNKYLKQEEACITYKVNSPCSILSDTGDIFICVEDPCKLSDCEYKCDECTGDCIDPEPEIEVKTNSNNEITLT